MGNRLDGKVAVVTGGGRGIGRGVALLLAEEGAALVVNDLGCEVDGTGASPGPADQVVEQIRSSGGRAVASYGDVASMASGEALIQQALDSFGRLDVLVNSAGIRRDRTMPEMSAEDFYRLIDSNVKGTFVPTRFASIVFRQQRSGRIVSMTSDAGLGEIGMANYAAASEAIVGMTRNVARDMGRYGVTCNSISPVARTRLFPGSADERGEWDGPGSADDPENVAPLAVYLCTDAAPHVNGRVFGVRQGSIYLYSNPEIERSLHKWGNFTMDEMDALVPGSIGSSL